MKHFGMDVHSTTTDVSVVNNRGKEVLYRQVNSTKEELVGRFVREVLLIATSRSATCDSTWIYTTVSVIKHV
jgi:hypothetical protein